MVLFLYKKVDTLNIGERCNICWAYDVGPTTLAYSWPTVSYRLWANVIKYTLAQRVVNDVGPTTLANSWPTVSYRLWANVMQYTFGQPFNGSGTTLGQRLCFGWGVI